jgi:serine/threonine-protein kinase
MSPEQIQGQPVSGGSDQFSLAVIAYEMLSGEKPFTGDSMPALVFKIVQEDPVPVQHLNSTLGWAADTVLKRALAKNPADRYPSCSDFIFALENACRASKNWKPIAPGVLPDLPTVGATESTRAAAAVPARAAATQPASEREPVPRFLRIARVLAAIVFVGGLVSALLVWALERFSDRDDPPAIRESSAAATDDRPSPTSPPPPAAAQESAPVQQPPPDPAKPEPPRALPSDTAQLATETRLVTNPPGAFIVIDGRSELSCVSPCTLTLPRGRHSLAATKEGYRRTLRILEVPETDNVFLNLDRTSGTVVVRSEPRGASIYVDGRLRPEQTPAVLTLPTGPHSIEIVRNGSRETHQVTVQESVITNVTVSLGGQ